MEVKFNPEVNLNHEERGQLSFTVATPGFNHINRIMRAEVDKFIVDLINVAEDNDKMVIAKHKGAKFVAQFFERIVSRLNEETNQFIRERGDDSRPVDLTEGLIDLGENTENTSSLLEGFELNEQLIEEELNSE